MPSVVEFIWILCGRVWATSSPPETALSSASDSVSLPFGSRVSGSLFLTPAGVGAAIARACRLNELQFKLREAHHSRKARRLEPAGHCRRLNRLARRRPLRTINCGSVNAEAVMDKPDAGLITSAIADCWPKRPTSRSGSPSSICWSTKKPKTASPCSRFATGWPNSA